MSPFHIPSRSTTPTPIVIVIGSGFAGLAAARALHDAALKVIVLESRDRIGGRVHTDHSLGFPVDMGASWLHGVSSANPLASLVGRLQVPMYRTSGDNSVLYDHDLESYALFENDGQQISTELVARVGDVFEEILEETRKYREQTKMKSDVSMRTAMDYVYCSRPELRLSGLEYRVLQWYLCRMEGWFATDMDKISLQHWEDEDLLDGGHGVMVKGYWPVTSALASGLDIRLNHRVQQIHYFAKSGGVEVITDTGAHFYGDAAVVTVPLGVLKSRSITFQPSLPAWKQQAISDLGVGNENKVALKFASAFWPSVEFLGIVASTTYGCSYFLNLHKATGAPVLVFMPAGSLADDLERMSDEAAVEFTMTQLRRILPSAPEPLGSLVSHWGSDRSSLGCYTYDPVGNSPDVYDRLRASIDDTLFFAGEATCKDFPATVHGAYKSGLDAARDVRRAVSAKQQHSAIELFAPAAAAAVGGSKDGGSLSSILSKEGTLALSLLPLQISRL
eukprot:TRINITY_DN7200_c0_g2_i1.p1 TRINITY_DN7200_c0_g2~~TRINITY_DN7200_c0_g2_i1.p1  ORF type:complete len:505 (-),score=49.49 TRINITY_DN7200_c0_g2_i1:1246-2760(-)